MHSVLKPLSFFTAFAVCSMGGFSCQQQDPQASTSEQTPSPPASESVQLSPPRTSGKIVFQSDRDGDWEIYVLHLDTGELLQLTRNTFADEYPVWSPDGSQIAFKSNRNGNFDIFVMQADGTEQRQLTDHPANDEDPAWSPDGKMLAFHSDRESTLEIYLIQPDGSGLTPFTRTLGKNALPAWSPDGSRIAYTGNRYLGWNVYVTTLDRDVDTRITDGHGACRPDWSPDGTTIAYVSQQDTSKSNISLMNPDGSHKRPFTHDNDHYDYYPAWSPDGRYLAYAKSADKEHGNWEVYVASVDSAMEFRLTNHPAQDKFPDWSGNSFSDDALKRLVAQQTSAYEAEALPRMIGSIVQEETASGGNLVLANPAEGAGFLVYGPYSEYAGGEYRITFRMKTGKFSDRKAEDIGLIDVATDAGQTILARRELRKEDFPVSDQFFDVPISVSIVSTSILEFRVFSEGVTTMAVDVIKVEEL